MHLFFIDNFCSIDSKVIVEKFQMNNWPKWQGIILFENEILPCDLYCFLYAKFGPPNGIHSIIRDDDSDSLIHWDWTLNSNEGWIQFLGMNFRTEVHFYGDWDVSKIDKYQLIKSIKDDLKNYARKLSDIKKNMLESWDQYINPYYQIKQAINQLRSELDKLELDPNNKSAKISNDWICDSGFAENYKEISQKFSLGIGLSYSLRLIIPVLAESFINFLIFILCIPEIKENNRLLENYIRSNIDIKIQLLHINCKGFASPVNWKSHECKNYNSLINIRNDLLHGNVNLKRLKINKVFFNKKVPIFTEYESLWQKTLGVNFDTCGFHEIDKEFKIVNDFIKYVLSCLNSQVREHVECIMDSPKFGINKNNASFGILFPNHIVDFSTPLIIYNKDRIL
ncbi:Uncharacterised protein [Legionella beliardensis]|uniref:Uncharacterized protein n=1 Tax=Legionella beliardensis TaxID=91822 RepID=A0A378I180_9GAMM|nr:hypothetical protein [Legionella beliardensis]STX28425.1 Uncharacterised protein [Legionella beliardensis]